MSLLDLLINPVALLYDVRIGAKGIEFTLLRFWVIAAVPFDNIEALETKWALTSRWTAYRFVNRWITRRLLINKKRAWFSKYVVISPADPDQFEAALRGHGVLVKG
jgi:hypothetical protein